MCLSVKFQILQYGGEIMIMCCSNNWRRGKVVHYGDSWFCRVRTLAPHLTGTIKWNIFLGGNPLRYTYIQVLINLLTIRYVRRLTWWRILKNLDFLDAVKVCSIPYIGSSTESVVHSFSRWPSGDNLIGLLSDCISSGRDWSSGEFLFCVDCLLCLFLWSVLMILISGTY